MAGKNGGHKGFNLKGKKRKKKSRKVTVKKGGRTFKLGKKIRSGQLRGKRPIMGIT